MKGNELFHTRFPNLQPARVREEEREESGAAK